MAAMKSCAEVRRLRVHTEGAAGISLADYQIPDVYLARRQTLKDRGPLGRDLHAPFANQAPQVSQFRRPLVRFHIIRKEDFVLNQKPELG
jgi:hypothetical protein